MKNSVDSKTEVVRAVDPVMVRLKLENLYLDNRNKRVISPFVSSLLGNSIFFLFPSVSSNRHSCVLTLFFVLHTTFILRKLRPSPSDLFFLLFTEANGDSFFE